jgi:hypothetical protein
VNAKDYWNMQGKEVHIDHMRLRIPGVENHEAHKIGQEVAKQLSESLPGSFLSGKIDTLNLKVSISRGASSSDISKLITETILKGLV